MTPGGGRMDFSEVNYIFWVIFLLRILALRNIFTQPKKKRKKYSPLQKNIFKLNY